MPTSSAVRFRERSELLDFLLEVSAVTSETLTDLDGLLANVAEIIQKVVPYELFAILLYHEKRRELSIRYAIGHREELVKKLVVKLGEGLTGAAAETLQPVLSGDVRKDPRYLNAVDAVRSELAVPMLARKKLVGVIDIQSTREDAYTQDDRALLQLIAGRVAATIENARLYRRAERQNRTQKILLHLAEEFSSILDLDELLRHIASALKALIRYDAFSILLVDQAKQCLRHRFSVRYDQRIDVDNVPLGRGITGAAVQSREVLRSDNTLLDPRYIPTHADVRSEVAVPLIARDRVIGVMDLESDHFAYFTDEHVRMLSLLAPQVANSVENARLYEELAQREKRIEQDVEAAHELQLALLPQQAPAIEGLEAAIGYHPARIIGGDLYDFYEYGPGAAMIAFGDVSGKGVAAALYGALVSGLLRTLAPRRRGPALLLQTMNDALGERMVDARYVTLLMLFWHAQTRRPRWPTPAPCRRWFADAGRSSSRGSREFRSGSSRAGSTKRPCSRPSPATWSCSTLTASRIRRAKRARNTGAAACWMRSGACTRSLRGRWWTRSFRIWRASPAPRPPLTTAPWWFYG
jgi:sigma-B regulation protein RsbU (phosphoserine phosphatase)